MRSHALTASFQTILLAIAFPGIDPVIVELGPLSLHWYGLGYVAGIMFAWWWMRLVDPACVHAGLHSHGV